MSKTVIQAGSASHNSLPGEIKASSFVSLSASKPAATAKPSVPTQKMGSSECVSRSSSYQIRYLNPSTAVLSAKTKAETFRQQDEEFPVARTESPVPRQRESITPLTPALTPVSDTIKNTPPPVSPPTSTTAGPGPGVVEAPASDHKAERQSSPRSRKNVTRSKTPTDGKKVQAPEPPKPRILRLQQKREPMPLTPIPEELAPEKVDSEKVVPEVVPEESSSGFDDLKLGLHALLKKVDGIQRGMPDPNTLAEKEQEIDTLHAYINSLETRHKRGKELLASREIQIMQLQGQLTAERTSGAYFKRELESYEDERAGFDARMQKSKQAAARVVEEKRQLAELLHESENSNTILYDELVASEADNDSLAKLLAEATVAITRLRDEKAEDAMFIQRTQQWLAESEARNHLLQKGADVSQSEAVDGKKMKAVEERFQQERDQWADIFETQRIQIAKLEDKLIDLQDEIERCQSEKDKHAETENVNQMLRAQITFLKFQRVTSNRKTAKVECELIETKKRLGQLKNATGIQETSKGEAKTQG